MDSTARFDFSCLSSLLIASTLIGCTGLTDFDRFRGPDDAGGVDAGVMDANVRPDARVDAGPCEDISDEVCNGDDDDCDGMVDEDFSLDTNPAHCGACNRACPPVPNSEPGCVDADCAPTCEDGFADCDLDYLTGCEASLDEAAHCGSCANDCGDMFCSDGECVLDCPGDEEVCGSTCVDTQRDLENCGGCGEICPTPANSVPICTTGSCGSTCVAGFADCDGDDSNGCEIDLTTTSDCGTCGTVCNFTNAAAACTDEACELTACNEGFLDCNTDPDDGCETQLGTTETCTSCGDTCPSPANAVAICGASGCDFTCAEGWADCNGMAHDGCEASLASATSCGSCATSCSGGTPLCEAGTGCVSGCTAPAVLCGGSCVDTATSPLHCGACDDPCADPDHASPTCNGGTCDFECDEGWADCNGDPLDGCERNTRTLTDCGGCGVGCALADASATCATGTCQISSCDTGHGDCNGAPADGCEVDLLTTAACGTCTTSCAVEDGVPACVATGGGTCVVASCDSGFGDCDMVYGNGCEASLEVLYPDADGDGYGVTANGEARCPAPGFVATGGDCVDTNIAIHPDQTDACDGTIDHDCDNMIDEGCDCTSGQTRPCGTDVGECAAGTESCVGGGWGACMGAVGGSAEVCDDLDNDCDGVIDDGFACRIGSTVACTTSCGSVGQRVCGSGCTYGPCIAPTETCNGRDDDCDGGVDEALFERVGGAELANSGVWTRSVGRADIAYWRPGEVYGVTFATSSPPGAVFGTIAADGTTTRFKHFVGTDIVRTRILAIDEAFVVFALDADQRLHFWIVRDPSEIPAPTPVEAFFGKVATFDAAVIGPELVRVVVTDGETLVAVDYDQAGDRREEQVFASGPATSGSSFLDLSVVVQRGMTALLLAEPNAVYYRRVNSLGATRAQSDNLLPAGFVFDRRFPRNTRLGLRPGVDFDTDRLVALFEDAQSGAPNAHYAVVDGGGRIQVAAGPATELDGEGSGLTVSFETRTMALGAREAFTHSALPTPAELQVLESPGPRLHTLYADPAMRLGFFAQTSYLNEEAYGFALYGCAP